MDDSRSSLSAILARCDAGVISPAVALMEMLIETEDDALVGRVLAESTASGRTVHHIAALREANRAGCAQIAAMLRSGVDSPPRNASVEEGVAFCARLFDWSVAQSEEASVALYSLGNPALLDEATREIARVLGSWGSLGARKRALDIGCGIGRMERALAPMLGEIEAIDVSERMIAAARRRCADLSNVVFSRTSGLHLRPFGDESFDLAFAIDSFPYIVQSGMSLVRAHFAEVARVLRVGGELVILNFSYRDNPDTDSADAMALAENHGFELLVSGATPFALWNGTAFRLRRSGR
jgi:SAM-dependent methyltransferase